MVGRAISSTSNLTGKQSPMKLIGLCFPAVRTGLEPATLGVTGRYSNQLNYRTKELLHLNFIKMKLNYILLGLPNPSRLRRDDRPIF